MPANNVEQEITKKHEGVMGKCTSPPPPTPGRGSSETLLEYLETFDRWVPLKRARKI